MSQARRYYALLAKDQDGKEDIAFLDAGEDEFGQIRELAVYTSADSAVARRHLEAFVGVSEVSIEPISAEDLLEALQVGMPRSVIFDGEKVAGSVLRAQLKDELGLPVKRPRLLPPPLGPENRN